MRARRKARAGKAGPRRPATVAALRRGIEILQCFESAAAPLGHAQIARHTGIPKPTVTRLLATLLASGFLRQDRQSDAYVLGPAIVSLAQAFLSSLDMRACARTHLQALAAATDGNVYLAIPDGVEMVVIESARPPLSGLVQRLSVGSRVSMLTSALGRAYLGALPPEERRRLAGGLGQVAERAARDLGSKGYCTSVAELYGDISTAAAPLRGPGGERFSVSCGGPSFTFSAERLRRDVAPRLLAAVRAIGREFGSAPRARAAEAPLDGAHA